MEYVLSLIKFKQQKLLFQQNSSIPSNIDIFVLYSGYTLIFLYGNFDKLNVRLRLSETKNSFLADTTTVPQPARLLTDRTYIG